MINPQRNRRLITAMACIGAVGAFGVAASAAPFGSTTYKASLRALNGSRAQGEAQIVLAGDQRSATVIIRATGLEPGGVHISHIHGLSANGQPIDSTCPNATDDADHDGFVELAEGQVKYGPILVDFMNIDPDQDGQVNFTQRIMLSGNEGASPLPFRHIVVHGQTVGAVGGGTPGEVDGTPGYKTVLPVLCGEIQQVSGGFTIRF